MGFRFLERLALHICGMTETAAEKGRQRYCRDEDRGENFDAHVFHSYFKGNAKSLVCQTAIYFTSRKTV